MRAIIMDHYEHPHHKELKDDNKYQKIHMDSESCIDDIYVQVFVENNVIKDLRFDGVACAISTASTSIMTDLLLNKSLDEAKEIIKNYFNMLYEKEYDEDLLEEANALKNTSKQANRIKCACLGWIGLAELIKDK
ncbi:MAG: SUF system NifU family Fe-S cluster assembly protein [Bacillales bacterium]|nr:SUF system NifU family Fe-S cluster assembly protein [Bacillales bacterium]